MNRKPSFWEWIQQPATARKFLIAFIGAILTAVSLGLLPEEVKAWVAVIVSFLTSFGVYVAPNSPPK